MIVIGADTHKRIHALAAVDANTGQLLGEREIAATEQGHLDGLRWTHELGRIDPTTRAYLARKKAEGKSRIEAMRCLKRHLARKYYRLLNERSCSRASCPSRCRLLSCIQSTQVIAPDSQRGGRLLITRSGHAPNVDIGAPTRVKAAMRGLPVVVVA